MLDGTQKAELANLVQAAKTGQLKKAELPPEYGETINKYFAELKENGLSKIKENFKTDIQEMHSTGIAGRKVASTEVLSEKTPNGDKITVYKDAEGNVIYEKREAHQGNREKVTYYGTDGKPTIGYNVYTNGNISGFQALEYNNGKEEVLWQTK